MAHALKILPNYSYTDFEIWEGRWELIDGIPYAMSPAPTPRHQLIANNIGAELRSALKGCKKCKVFQAIDYKVAENTVIEPDVSIICGKIEKKYIDTAPALVVEILSPSTALKDRHTKFGIYEVQGVKYYLIVSPEIEQVEVFHLQDGEYLLVAKEHDFQFDFDIEGCNAKINFAEIW